MNEIESLLPQVRPEVQNHLEKAKSFVVATAEDCRNADLFCVALDQLDKMIEDDFAKSRKAATDAFNAAKAATSAVKQQEEAHRGPVKLARGTVKQKIAAYQSEEERVRREKEAELQRQANKIAEDQQLADAELAEASGDKEGAKAIINQPIQAPVISLPTAAPKVQTRIAMRPFFTVTDPSKVKRDYLNVNEVLVGQLVRGQVKDQASARMIEERIGGIRIEFRAV